jgi:hypothetical protein
MNIQKAAKIKKVATKAISTTQISRPGKMRKEKQDHIAPHFDWS